MKIRRRVTKRAPYYALVVLVIGIVLSLPALTARPRAVFAAANADGCERQATLGGVAVGGIPAVISACNNCRSSSGLRWGALWISNAAGGGPGQALVLANREVGGRDKTATFDIHGMVYSCGHATDTPSAVAAVDTDLRDSSGASIPGIEYTTRTIPRGFTQTQYEWSGGGSMGGSKITDLDAFFSSPDSSCTDLSNGARDCSRTVQVYRCFNVSGQGCGSDPSVVRAIINDTTNDDNKNRFYSKSMVEIPEQGSDISGYSAKSDADGSARVEISTDEREVTVNFKHKLFYDVISPFGDNDTVQAPSVDWTIYTRTGAETEWTGDKWNDIDWKEKRGVTGTWTSSSGKVNKNSGWEVGNEEVPVSFREDESGVTKRVCRRVQYENKFVDFVVDGLAGSGYNWVVEGGKKKGHSQACAYITYISSDEDNDPLASGSVTLGSSTGSEYAMLAGENATLTINGTAHGVKSRRLIGTEAVVFNHAAETTYNKSLVANNTRFQGTDLCKLFREERTPAALHCATLSKYTVDYTDEAEAGVSGSDDTKDKGAVVAVPDDIGQKYCNAFGYKFRYFYGIREDGANTTKWTSEPEKDYTFVPGPACRTIAKKPTTAFWNGSVLMANGSIVTSLARRHQLDNGAGPDLGNMTYDGVYQTANSTAITNDRLILYGSWSEYLAASGSGMDKARAIASGSSISLGSTKENNVLCPNGSIQPWASNSPLTISNVGCNLAGAGANLSSSSFRTRLTAYLEKLGTVPTGVTIIGDSSTDMSIYNNIVSDGTFGIRSLPQTIIFANNINIAENVTRIDAWIIAKGTINTCAGFAKGTTGGTGTTSDGVGNDGSSCTKQLVFNGPVVAGNLELNRTFGADSQARQNQGLATNGATGYSTRQSSAEVFNLRADAYLWAYAQASRYSSSYSEVYSRELAPRY